VIQIVNVLDTNIFVSRQPIGRQEIHTLSMAGKLRKMYLLSNELSDQIVLVSDDPAVAHVGSPGDDHNKSQGQPMEKNTDNKNENIGESLRYGQMRWLGDQLIKKLAENALSSITTFDRKAAISVLTSELCIIAANLPRLAWHSANLRSDVSELRRTYQ
jgi:hypothetical protein